MKKILILVLIVSSTSTVFSKTKDFSKWSFTVESGLAFYLGDIPTDQIDFVPKSAAQIPFGGTIEYAYSPIWGVAVDFYHFPLSADNGKYSFETNMNTSVINATINFTKFIFPQTDSKLHINGTLGVGIASYKPSYINLGDAKVTLPSKISGSIPVTLSAEYNFTKSVALGFKLHYRAYTTNDLEGSPLATKGVTNDYVAASMLYLRYKLQANKKHHLRNTRMEDFEPNKAYELGLRNAAKIANLDTALQSLEDKVDRQGLRIDSVAVVLSNDGPDSDGDGVPDHRDMSPNTATNTAVDFWGKALPISVSTATDKSKSLNDDIPAVYFGFDQVDLDDEALIAVSRIAKEMKANVKLLVEVRGYCDYSGANPYNNLLSQKRSDRVKAELVKVWGISPDRIISNGKGVILEPRSQYKPNRRCDFFFDKL